MSQVDDLRAGYPYFLPPEQWYWQWQEQGRVVAWSDGPTIAFRDELDFILPHLAPMGLPPLGSLVLLLAACRESWNDAPSRVNVLTECLTLLVGSKHDHEAVRSLIRELDRVRQLPDDLRRALPARAELAAMVFETARQCSSLEHAKVLLEEWPKWRNEPPAGRRIGRSASQFMQEVEALLPGLSKVDERSLRLRIGTGLETLPAPAPVEMEPALFGRALLDQLLEDPEFSGVARLARQLLAVVSLPRPMSEPAELPEGGVSDISNRGPLDRLLLSELANDEATLAVRVAMNEALYYRREQPPSPPPRARKLLIDSGVRMWGVPRVYAAAVGLALAAQPEKNSHTQVYRAGREQLAEVDFSTRSGLANHLGALESTAHPGEVLKEFANELADKSGDVEGVLITCEEVLADADFQRQLARCPFAVLYLATVSRDGRFRLVARSRRGTKVLKEATLDLDQILAERPNPRLVDVSRAGEKPAILNVQPFPLRLSVTLEPERAWHVEALGVFSYTRDGRLLWWNNPGYGGRQLAQGLPSGRLHACQTEAREGVTLAVIGKLSPNGLYALQINAAQSTVAWTKLCFPQTPTADVGIHGDHVLLRHEDTLSTLNALTGELLSTQGNPSHYVQRGRVLSPTLLGQQVLAFTSEGPSVLQSHGEPKLPPLAAFQARSVSGIVVISATADIELEGPTGRRTTIVNHGLFPPFRVTAVSRDGLRYFLQGRSSPKAAATFKSLLVHTLNGAVRANYGDPDQALEPYLAQYMRPRVLRSKFSAVGIDGQQQLTLVGRKQLAWPISYEAATNEIRLAKKMSTTLPAVHFAFASQDSPSGWSMHRTTFRDGTIAWLDGRGLLHLRSSNASLPEVSLVLSEGPLAGWLNDGRTWGPKYFHGQAATTPAREIYEQVIKRIIERIQ